MWFTADQHFFHENIIRFCGRPFIDANRMNKKIMDNYNDLVCDSDEVFMLGDFSILGASQGEKIASIVRRLRGKKHLVLGNHDECKPFKYEDMGFITVHTMVKVEEFWLMHDPAKSEIVKNQPALCGHVHTLFTFQRNCLNVGVDVWNFQPVHIETVREIFNENL